MDAAKEKYLSYLSASKHISANTKMAYRKDLNDYITYLKEHTISLRHVYKNTIFTYENHLYQKGKSNASVARALSSVRGFHQYLYDTGYMKTNPAIQIHTPQKERVLPNILSLKEIEKLLNQPNCATYLGCRDKAILELLYATGIRVSELVQLKLADVDLKRGTIACTDRIIPFGAFSSKALSDYIALSPFFDSKKNESYLFLNSGGKQFTRQGVWKMIRKYKKSAKIEKDTSPQVLRNSFAAHLLENGADIKIVQELMGHTALTSTLIYAEFSKNRLLDAYEKAHPRAKLPKTE